MSSTHELLQALRRGSLSRNRNFALFEGHAARRALRAHLMLRQLEQDLLRHSRTGTLRVEHEPTDAPAGAPRLVLRIEDPDLRLRRRVYLEPEELELLLEREEVARALTEQLGAGPGEVLARGGLVEDGDG